ncbi:MAG: SufE family protein [Rickettsiales bacterium]|jgi:sulfur transfer protein SufE|nr:SufE family protein [Rickettsiales bacterium]
MEKFENIKEIAAEMPDDEARLEYVMELGENLPPIPAGRVGIEVKGCSSRVHIYSEQGDDGRMKFYASADSRMVGGLVHCMLSLADGKTRDEIKGIDFKMSVGRLGFPIGASRLIGMEAVEKLLKGE